MTTEASNTAERVARVTAFATLGVLSTVQDLLRTALGGVEGADPELVAEETICLVATATARAAAVGLREEPGAAAAVVPVLLDLPFAYRDYLLGSAMIARQDAGLREAAGEIEQRLRRKREFYSVHLPGDAFPGERLLTDKMGLWMGRISPPGLPETPTDRLDRLGLVEQLVTHLKLVLAFGRQGG